MNSNWNNQELISKAAVDKMLKEQEEYFQNQMKKQYQYFENMIRQLNLEGPESPKFWNDSNQNKLSRLNIKVETNPKSKKAVLLQNNVTMAI